MTRLRLALGLLLCRLGFHRGRVVRFLTSPPLWICERCSHVADLGDILEKDGRR